MGLSQIASTVLQAVWPQICVHCRGVVEERFAPLCPKCRLTLKSAQPPYCQRCADPLTAGQARCARCSLAKPACRLIRAAFWYRGAAVSLVHSLKYRGRRSAADAAGAWMAQAFEGYPELGSPDALVPVPMHSRKRRLRGFNQAFLIAEALAGALGLPLLDILVRRKPTLPQWRLGRQERLDNLSGVIGFSGKPGAVEGKKLLLIDDVCTSGASLEACAAALRQAGARTVDGYVLARQSCGAST